jgi:hypothetical protein
MKKRPEEDYLARLFYAINLLILAGLVVLVVALCACSRPASPAAHTEAANPPGKAPDWHQTETNPRKRQWLEALPAPLPKHRFKTDNY